MDETGRSTGVGTSVVVEITERKRAEQESARLATETRLLLESNRHEGIYGIDLQGHCTFINRAGAELLGFQPEEMLGQDMHILIHHHRKDGSPYPVEDFARFTAP